jgi:tRNA(Arg) A34 adenosine deaminase TadA
MNIIMNEELVSLAKKAAIYSDLKQQHASILIADDMIITGYNHFSIGKNTITVHAEEDAINNFIALCRKKYLDDAYIRRRLHRALLITVRVKNDIIKCSAPCQNCIEIIKSYGIRQIIYSDSDENANTYYIQQKSRDLSNRPSSGFRWKARKSKSILLNR